MEDVFDLREFIVKLFKKFKSVLILGLILAILGACYGYFIASKDSEEETYTTTSAASINLINAEETPQWSPTNMMSMVDALSSSDFVYLGFFDFLSENGYSKLFGGVAVPTAADVKNFAKFYSKGNLLLVNITSSDGDTSSKVSELAIEYLDQTITGYINNVKVDPQDKQTAEVVKTPAPSKLRKALKYGIFGGGGGCVLAILFIFFFDVFDLRIKSGEDLKKYNIPVLAVVSERKS